MSYARQVAVAVDARSRACVTPRATRMPIAATLRSGPRSSAGTQTPLRPSTRAVASAELGAHVDQHLLDPAHVGDHVDRVGQPHDRVADQLARAVPGDLAAAVDVDHRRAVERPVRRLGALAGRVDARVLQQQHRVGRRAVRDGLVQPPLLGPGPSRSRRGRRVCHRKTQGAGHASA